MSAFTVCTFNMGAGVDDFYHLCRHVKPDLKFANQEEETAFKAKYQLAEKATKNCLIEQHIDIYCLQEISSMDRPLIKSLKKKGFNLVHLEGHNIFNTLIALNTERFHDVKNFSKEILGTSFKKDVSIATALDLITKKRITIVSAHVPGFNFMHLNEETLAGDYYCKKIVKTLSKIECTWQVIGADMNSNPEVWNARFETFTGNGFQLLRTHSPTNVNSRDSLHQKREIDFLFVKEVKPVGFLSLFSHSKVATIQAKLDSPDLLGWDPEKNSSDHQPVIFKLS